MSFRPTINTVLTIQGTPFHFVEHPAAPGIPYGQTGRRAKVFCIQNEAGKFFALKIFFYEFRAQQIERSALNLSKFAQLPGLSVCARTVLTPQNDVALIQQNADLLYAVLMPWVVGKTWYEVIYERMALTPRQSYLFAQEFVRTMTALEQSGAAHCDISSGNVMLPGILGKQPPVALVDVEEMFAPGFEQPAKLPAGTPGYNHKTSATGLWNQEADRFAGAVLLAELLGWCDPLVRQAAAGSVAQPGEQYFDTREAQQPCQRYDILLQSLKNNWGENIANLFQQVWQSNTLQECPPFATWQAVIALLQQRAAQLDEMSAAPINASSPVKGWRTMGPSAPADASTAPPTDSLSAAFLPSGFLLNGRYEIQEQLGEGGFGTVYLAIDRQTRTRCVVKANRDPSLATATQFATEARILRGLHHPNLAKVYDYLEIPGHGQYIIMEFVAGDTLQSLSKRALGPLPQEHAIGWTSQICDVLEYLHHQKPPVIHRDIKPANIIIDSTGRAKLVDFGIAKIANPGAGTTLGARAYTPGFSPPEQYGGAATDARSDIYALGATLYALLTGKIPPESVARMSGKSLPLMQDLNPKVGQQVQMAIYRAMSLDAGQRFQTAAAFKAGLYAPTAGTYVAPPIYQGDSTPQPKPQKKPNWLVAALVAGFAGLACLSFVGVAAFIFWGPKAATPTTEPPTTTKIFATDEATVEPAATEPFTPVDESPTPAPPTKIPAPKVSNSQRIVYAAGGEQSNRRSIFIEYVNNPNTQNRITSGTDQFGDNFPTFSPDGNSIAFSRCYQNRSDGCTLFVKDLNTGNPKSVLTGHKVMRPKWCISTSSAYRDWVVFEDRGKNGNNYVDAISSIGLVNTANGEFKKLTSGTSDWSANWSPDCSQVIFTRYDENDTVALNADLMLVDINTGNTTSLIGSGNFSPPAEISPAWSSDNQWIAYRKADDTTGDGRYNASQDRTDIWLIGSDGNNDHALIANSYNVSSIAWSTDGKNIVFTTADLHMYVCDLQGNITYTFGGNNYLHPDWAP